MATSMAGRVVELVVTSDRGRAAFAGPHSNDGVDRDDPDLAVADLAGPGGLHDHTGERLRVLVVDHSGDTRGNPYYTNIACIRADGNTIKPLGLTARGIVIDPSDH